MVCGMRIKAHANEDEWFIWFSSDGIRWRMVLRVWELGTWQKLINLCLPFLPEHIEWDSVTRLVIGYSDFQDLGPRWDIFIFNTDEHKEDGMHPNLQREERIPIATEEEGEFRRKVYDYIAETFLPMKQYILIQPIFPTGEKTT